MSDDLWRRGRDDDFDDDWDDLDVSEPSFADDDAPALPRRQPSMFEREPEGPSLFGNPVPPRDQTDPPIRFGDDQTGALPHWTEPPTGEVPRLFGETDPTDDLDIWSSFAQSNAAPVWRDEREQAEAPTMIDDLTSFGEARLGALDESQTVGDPFFEIDEVPPVVAKPREPIRIGIDNTTDDSRGIQRGRSDRPEGSASAQRPRPSGGSSGPGGPPRSGRPAAQPKGGVKGRDMPTALALGLGLAAVYVALMRFFGTTGIMALIAVILGLAGFEFFGKATERGYRPAVIPGILACALTPLAAYWQVERGVMVCLFLAVVASVLTAISADGLESGPLPNTAITLTGVAWIGVLGSFAGMILKYGEPIGTDTITLLVVGVAANDVGALLIGSAAGRTPLREWISPNKTVEGFLGGAFMTILALWLTNIANGDAQVWDQFSEWIVLALVIIVLAPIGDLTESMFKRNLEIKDFGTILPGHGGVLDRFDGFLFVLPGAYYVMQVLEPWVNS